MRSLPFLRHRRQQGVAAVEFALLLIPLLILGFGAVEYGRLLYQYNTMVNSVRSAARLIAQRNPDNPSSYATALADARCLAVYGVVNCHEHLQPLVPGLTRSQVHICDRSSVAECDDLTQSDLKNVDLGTDQGAIHLVMVRVSGYQFHFLGLPFIGTGSSLALQPIQSVMRQGL